MLPSPWWAMRVFLWGIVGRLDTEEIWVTGKSMNMLWRWFFWAVFKPLRSGGLQIKSRVFQRVFQKIEKNERRKGGAQFGEWEVWNRWKGSKIGGDGCQPEGGGKKPLRNICRPWEWLWIMFLLGCTAFKITFKVFSFFRSHCILWWRLALAFKLLTKNDNVTWDFCFRSQFVRQWSDLHLRLESRAEKDKARLKRKSLRHTAEVRWRIVQTVCRDHDIHWITTGQKNDQLWMRKPAVLALFWAHLAQAHEQEEKRRTHHHRELVVILLPGNFVWLLTTCSHENDQGNYIYISTKYSTYLGLPCRWLFNH